MSEHEFVTGGLLVRKPRILDLFCGAGGAGMGYYLAGFQVVGVDLSPQPRYPFEFHQADALTFPFDGFDAIHASPPCHRYTTLVSQRGTQSQYVDLVDETRDKLIASGMPYVIENVPGAPLRSPLMLCGTMFGLRVLRHRHFESNILLLSPGGHPNHGRVWSYDKRQKQPERATSNVLVTGWNYRLKDGLAAMGIDWMTSRDELSEAIPPAYTTWIGQQLLSSISMKAEYPP